MVKAVLSPGVRSTAARWFRSRLVGVLPILFFCVFLVALHGVWLSEPPGMCACEHNPAYGTPPPGRTPVATSVAVPERSYENTCDGAQAYVNDLDEATNAHFARRETWTGTWEFFLEYYRASNPPPILEEWTDANIAVWAAASDIAASPHFYFKSREAIDEAEEELEDACEDYQFTEQF
jgi:hypothetical protein